LSSFDTMGIKNEIVFRQLADRKHEVEPGTILGVSLSSFMRIDKKFYAKGAPWYSAGETQFALQGSLDEAVNKNSFEGVGEGWFYSHLGGGDTNRPQAPSTPPKRISVDESNLTGPNNQPATTVEFGPGDAI